MSYILLNFPLTLLLSALPQLPLCPRTTPLLFPFRKGKLPEDINQTWHIITVGLDTSPHIKDGLVNPVEGKVSYMEVKTVRESPYSHCYESYIEHQATQP